MTLAMTRERFKNRPIRYSGVLRLHHRIVDLEDQRLGTVVAVETLLVAFPDDGERPHDVVNIVAADVV